MGKNREIGILRGLAICAVVGIHTFSIGVSNVTTGMSAWAYQIFHAMLQFAVPCFIFISSVLLSYSLHGNELQVKKFYMKKIKHIVIPYILWTLFYLLFKVVTHQMAISDFFIWQNWILWIFAGKAYTHLYYMSIILQLYLFTPLLLALVKGMQGFFRKYDFIGIIVVSVTLQIGIYFLNRYFIYQYFKYQATMMIWYIYIILFGIWIGYNYDHFIRGLKKHSSIVWMLYGINAVIYVWYKVCLVNKTPINTAWYQCNWFAYAIFTTLLLLWICVQVKDKNMHNPLTRVIEVVGDYSFGIYLMHPVITYILRKFIHITQPFVLLIILTVCYMGIMLICIGIIKGLRFNKWANIIVGEYTLWKQSDSLSSN